MSVSSDVLRDPDQEVSKFGEKLFSYCLQKFGMIYKEYTHSSLFTEEIGDAVVIFQIHIRDFLRDYLARGIEKMVGVTDSNQRLQALKQLMVLRDDRTLDDHPIETIIIGYLALITELIIFMDSAGLPVRMDWFTQIWTFIYDTRLKQNIEGRWENVKKEAEKICDKCPRKEELFEELKSLDHPYAEMDPSIETSFKDLDPFFMFCTVGTGFEFPRKPGYSCEVLERLVKKLNIDPDA